MGEFQGVPRGAPLHYYDLVFALLKQGPCFLFMFNENNILEKSASIDT
jgi:hypothetical protein